MANGNVWARDLNYGAINAGNPAHPGETIQLYANGLGAVTNQPASGDPLRGVQALPKRPLPR